MNIFINILVGILVLIIGYLFGSIPTSVIIGKLFFHQDPRDFGSHNPGGTNAGRLWGKKVGFIVITLDMIKSILPIWLCYIILTLVPFNGVPLLGTGANFIDGGWGIFIIQYPVYWLCGAGCLIGNCYPLFTEFKGGKGVATFSGVAISCSWLLLAFGICVFFFVLILKKYVSLASIVTVWSSSILMIVLNVLVAIGVLPINFLTFFGYGNTFVFDWVFCGFMVLGSALVTWRHHENIARLLNHEERKITWIK